LICAQFALSAGRRGRVAVDSVPALVQDALQSIELDPSELDKIVASARVAVATHAATSEEGPLPPTAPHEPRATTIGVLTKFWFTSVWPQLSPRLLNAHHAPSATQMVQVVFESEDG